MDEKATAIIWGAFVADALALGAHWVYNAPVIEKKFGRLDRYVDPLTSYHKGKKAGDFTHYGDQMVVLLETVAEDGGFDVDRFIKRWRTFFAAYDGYFDKATKATLKNLDDGKHYPRCGSSSDDLGGAARIAPLVFAARHDTGVLVPAVRAQTAFTHNTSSVIDSAEFFSLATLKVLQGDKPSQAVAQAMTGRSETDPLNEWVEAGLNSTAVDTVSAIKDFGQMCATNAALPATIHLIAKYEDDFEQAMVENVMAGGDSAARGMLTGMLLGAYLGPDGIPGQWLERLNARDHIATLLSRLE